MTPLSSNLAAALRQMLAAYAPNADVHAARSGEASLHSAVRAAREALHRTEARAEEIHLPNCIVGTVHQSGAQLSQAPAGATLTLHFREGAETPHAAEIVSDDGEEGGDMGLEWEGTMLTGYDGVFSLPVELAEELARRGFTLNQYVDPRPTAADAQDRADGRA